MIRFRYSPAGTALLGALLLAPLAAHAHAQAPRLTPLPAADQPGSLAALKRAIGDARIVLLGETTRGDGATHAAKTRIVGMLHRELGFDVVAFESGQLDMERVDAALADADVPLAAAAGGGLFVLWAQSAEVEAALAYVRASRQSGGRPITVAGFDTQLTATDRTAWERTIVGAFERAGATHAELSRFVTINQVLNTGTGGSITVMHALADELRTIQQLFVKYRAAMERNEGATQAELIGRSLDDAAVHFALMEAERTGRSAGQAADARAREQRLGENLLWLARARFPERRIVVWLTTPHALHAPAQLLDRSGAPVLPHAVSAGSMLREALPDEVYTIAFTAAGGASGDALGRRRSPVPEPVAGSLEAACRTHAPADAFVDLRGSRASFVSHLLAYRPLEAVWSSQLDGVFCVQRMRPARRVGGALPER